MFVKAQAFANIHHRTQLMSAQLIKAAEARKESAEVNKHSICAAFQVPPALALEGDREPFQDPCWRSVLPAAPPCLSL
jgi:hypothetical protein